MKNLNEMPWDIGDLRSNGLLRNQSVSGVPTCEKKRIPGVQVIGKIHDTKIIINKMVSKARTWSGKKVN